MTTTVTQDLRKETTSTTRRNGVGERNDCQKSLWNNANGGDEEGEAREKETFSK